MKLMKSASSEGSECARRFAISGGIKYVMLLPVGATILAKANRVCSRQGLMFSEK